MKPLSAWSSSSLIGSAAGAAPDAIAAAKSPEAIHFDMSYRYFTMRASSRNLTSGREVGRRGEIELDRLAGGGVGEGEVRGVQHQARRRRASVEIVPDERMADRRQVNADLVGAAGVQLDAQAGAAG